MKSIRSIILIATLFGCGALFAQEGFIAPPSPPLDEAALQQEAIRAAERLLEAEANMPEPLPEAESPPPPRRGISTNMREADMAAHRRLNALEEARIEIDSLLVDQRRWTSELHYARTKLVNAEAQVRHATSRDQLDQLDRWRREVMAWEVRVQTAERELAAINTRLHATREVFQVLPHTVTGEEVLVAGDAVEIIVIEDESLNGLYPVRRGGYVVMPRIGRIFVAGRDLPGAEMAVREALQSTQLRNATVLIERAYGGTVGTSRVIFLAGEFVRPGPWTIPASTAPSLVTTILQSGGVKESGDMSRVRLLRVVAGQQLMEEFNVAGMLSGEDLTSDVPVNAGDIIVIPGAPLNVFVTGNVARPGQLSLAANSEMKVYSAILQSGGFSRFANRKRVFVLRENGTESKERIAVDIDSVMRGRTPDLILQHNDIIVVPERFFSF